MSLSQIAKPYVDNWLRTRQSVSDLLHSFSIMVLKTNLAAVLNAEGAEQMLRRAVLLNQARDNRHLMMIDRDTEDFANLSAPLGSLDRLQAQSQEHMAAVTGIPLIVLLGITPSGLTRPARASCAPFTRG
ncbi:MULTISPECIES: anti-CBASS protein Acb1 family protein [unclassified Caballeronia]|uniref:anti-CBASS protein Acb1 family protein n=1 Tax=unclassified Caballeronia TaxID=2646786 RepID=UPI0021056B44|nr:MULTISPECIES: anti-CBASS Acb1 family protein [unclassified Caballeronia]